MTHGRDGFSLAHRAALMVANAWRALAIAASAAVIASLAVVGTSQAGPIDPLAVTNSNPVLQGSLSIFAASAGPNNQKPTTIISGGQIVPGFSSTALLGGVAANPTDGALYVTQNLSLLAPGVLPDFIEAFAPDATGASGPVLAIPLVSASCGAPKGKACFPQDLAFVGAAGPSLGDFYASHFTGGPATVGAVILYPANAGTTANPNGIPIGKVADTLTCTAAKLTDTKLLLPVGVATDALGNVYVANAGKPAGAPAYVAEYPLAGILASATGCLAPTNLVGVGTLVQAGFDAVDPAGNIWVSDLVQNAIFEFSPTGGPTGAPITSIIGKKTNLRSPMGISLSPAGLAHGVDDVYVANNGRGSIVLFEDVSSGGLLNIHPLLALKGRKTKLNLPVGVAAF